MKNNPLSLNSIWFGFLILAMVMNFMNCNSQHSDIKLLMITGGHEFEEAPFFEMFDSFRGVSYEVLGDSGSIDPYSYAADKNINVLVFYHMTRQIFADRQASFLKLLEQGKGMVFLHHSLVAYQNWPEFENIIGGRYFLDSTQGSSPSTYHEEVNISLSIVDKTHPVTKGIEDFQIFDEVYGNYRVLPRVQPLVSTNHPESTPLVGWANSYKNSRIVFIQPGHGPQIFADPNYRKMLQQAIRWVGTSKP
jgi:type 1 glutamine amidotransferase